MAEEILSQNSRGMAHRDKKSITKEVNRGNPQALNAYPLMSHLDDLEHLPHLPLRMTQDKEDATLLHSAFVQESASKLLRSFNIKHQPPGSTAAQVEPFLLFCVCSTYPKWFHRA